MQLKGKHIILGITGSIAAYKAAMLCRLLVKEGAEVRVIMTPLAKQFITPLTMATLSKHPILVEFFNPENGEWNSHVSLGEWADMLLIAPATANTLAKMTTGIADNLLLTTYLSARSVVAVAPAMDLDMYAHITTQQNLRTLAERGVAIIEPEAGELASGLVGKGRMAEPEEIVEQVKAILCKQQRKSLAGKRYFVTAGATIEAIDPVRYITNHSTGKMGYAIAEELANRGAEVKLISGRTTLPTPAGVEHIDVLSAADMYNAAVEAWCEVDGAVMCAAVADYTPEEREANVWRDMRYRASTSMAIFTVLYLVSSCTDDTASRRSLRARCMDAPDSILSIISARCSPRSISSAADTGPMTLSPNFLRITSARA